MKATPYLEQCLELEGNQFDPMADFSSRPFRQGRHCSRQTEASTNSQRTTENRKQSCEA